MKKFSSIMKWYLYGMVFSDNSSRVVAIKKSWLVIGQACIFSLLAGQAWGANSYVWVNPNQTGQQYIDSQTLPVPYSDANLQGYAYAGTGTLKAKATGAQTVPSSFSYGDGGRIQTGFHNEVYIGPGSSNLNIGDNVTLNLSLSLDGQLFTSVFSPPGGYVNNNGGSANGAAKLNEQSYYTIHDVTPTGSASLAVDFQPKAGLIMNGSFIGTDWEYVINDYSWSWSLSSNAAPTQSDELVFDIYNRPIYNCTDCTNVQNQTIFFDTGVLNIDFSTTVGNTLYLNGLIDVYATVGNGGSDGVLATAESDFFNTFGFDITDSYGTGVDLSYQLASPVPVPGAVWLLGSGIIGLIGVRRRKKRTV